MACRHCDFKGYIETEMIKGSNPKPMIKQCFKCNDIEAYSQRIQAMVFGLDHKFLEKVAEIEKRKKRKEPCRVLKFQKKKDG